MDLLVSIAFMVGGLVCVLLAIYLKVRFRRLSNWPRCPGLITGIVSEEVVTRNSDGSLQRSMVYGVQYTYCVGGHTYAGVSSVKSDINRTCKVNDEIVVVYDPDRPEISDQYVRVFTWIHWWPLIGGLGLLAMGIYILM